MIRQAVILAAGNGSRIQRFKGDVPKPLRKVAGLSLIKRSILSAKKAGIRDFIIVVGCQGEKIIQSLEGDDELGVNLRFITNPEYENKANGVSLLSAKPYVEGKFLLMMADHIFDPLAIEQISKVSFSSREVLLGVDQKVGDVFDLEDATKVLIQGDRLFEIGKQLKNFNALDIGLFVGSPAFFEVLEEHYAREKDVSLSDGVRALALQGRMRVADLSDYFWQDVDTPEALHHAQEYLFSTLRKPTDGWISAHFNRRISIAITRLLIRTNLSANHVTGLITLIGIFSGVFVSSGRYLDVAIGGVLFQLASILDGCDGEMAKLRMTSSKMGEWLDTISDNLTYFAFLIGVSMGAHRQIHGVFEVFEAAFMFAGLAFCLILMFYYLIYYTNSGTLVAIQKEITEEENKQKSQEGIFHWLSKIRFMMKRDFFAAFFMILALANQLPVILHLSVIGVNLTWMVLLAFKKEIFRVVPSRKVLDSSTQK